MSLVLTVGGGTVELYNALCVEYSIPYKEQHSILVFYDMVKHHPEQLEMKAPMGGGGIKRIRERSRWWQV
jgi:hypothetical protein